MSLKGCINNGGKMRSTFAYWVRVITTVFVLLGSSNCGKKVNDNPLPPPFKVTARALSASQIKISWSYKDDERIKGFNIYSIGEQKKKVASVSYSIYVISELKPGTSYCFKVSSFDYKGRESVLSKKACTKTFRLQEGYPLWVYWGLMVISSPAIGLDGTIYFGTLYNYFYALNPDGTLKWRYETCGEIWSSPAIGSDGTIYFGSLDHYFYALNPDGTLKWKYETDGEIFSSPAVGLDGTIYFGSQNHYFYALNPDGTLKWKYETGGVISSPAIGSDGTIYFGSLDYYFYALNADGTLKWRYETEGCITSNPAIGSDGAIYFGSNDFYIYALNSDGSLKWKYKTDGEIVASPAISKNDTIFLGSLDGNFYALNADGDLLWKCNVVYPGKFEIKSSPSITPDGVVYIGSSGMFMAIYSSSLGLADSPWPMFMHDLRHTGRQQNL